MPEPDAHEMDRIDAEALAAAWADYAAALDHDHGGGDYDPESDPREALIADVGRWWRAQLPDGEPPDAIRAAAAEIAAEIAARRMNGDTAPRPERIVEMLLGESWLRTAADKWPDPPPAVLSRVTVGGQAEALLGAGLVGIVSGPGGVGKSTLTAQLALAAAAHEPSGAGLAALRLHMAKGPVVMACGEDSGAAVAARLKAAAKAWNVRHRGPALSRVHVVGRETLTGPLWRGPDARDHAGATDELRRLAALCARVRPTLVVVDPASAALADTPSGDGYTVRRFVSALAAIGERCGAAVLVVAHSTKGDRDGSRPTAGSIAGSHQWHDTARLCLDLRHIDDDTPGIAVTVTKANGGRAGPIASWLTVHVAHGHPVGLAAGSPEPLP